MQKCGGYPVPIGLDLDNTTFGPKSDNATKIIEWRNRFSAVLFCLMDHEKLPGTTLLQLLNQVPQKHIHFITNRCCDNVDVMTTYTSLASTFLGRSINFEISFEPGRSVDPRKSA